MKKNEYFPESTCVLIDDIRQITVVRLSAGNHQWISHRDPEAGRKIRRAISASKSNNAPGYQIQERYYNGLLNRSLESLGLSGMAGVLGCGIY